MMARFLLSLAFMVGGSGLTGCERRPDVPAAELRSPSGMTQLRGRIHCDWADKRLPTIETTDGRRLCIFQAKDTDFQDGDEVLLEGQLDVTDPEALLRTWLAQREEMIAAHQARWQSSHPGTSPPSFDAPLIPQVYGAHMKRTVIFALKRVIHRRPAP